jgi:hypothetical protein
MRKAISRNTAIISAIFIVAFSIMLIINYFQVSSSETLQSEVIENLKQVNEELGNNLQLQEQIRELDLLARKAYFINLDRLKTGVIILVFMILVFVISIRIYFEKSKDIPNKEIDPIDEWLIKSKTRKYVVWITSGLALGGIVFAVLTSPYLKTAKLSEKAINPETEVHTQFFNEETDTETLNDLQENDEIAANNIDEIHEIQATENEKEVQIQVSKVTHNAFRGNNSSG